MGKIENLIRKLQLRCDSARTDCSWKIKGYVRKYLESCLLNNRSVQIFTLWCLSRGLEKRVNRINGRIDPLPSEKDFFKNARRIGELFKSFGLKVDWIILLAPSAVPSGQISDGIEVIYKDMLDELSGSLNFIVIEEGLKIIPSALVAKDFYSFVSQGAEDYEFKRRVKLWEKRGLELDEKVICDELKLSVATKAVEAKMMVDEFGDFLLVPVEFTERYVFHNILVKDFTDRLLPIVKPYPWRDEED